MRIFQNCAEAVKEIERDLAEMGHKVHPITVQDQYVRDRKEFDSREIVGYSFTLLGGGDWRESFAALGMKDVEECIRYVDLEVKSRMDRLPSRLKEKWSTSINPGVAWKERPHVWNPFLHEGKFSYTYAQRIFDTFGINQIAAAETIASEDPNSRQLIIQIYEQTHDSWRRLGRARIPCTMHYQALLRNQVMYLIHVMRSLDLYTHLAVDLSISWNMADMLSKSLTLGLGGVWKPQVIMQIGSLHAFRKDIESRGVF